MPNYLIVLCGPTGIGKTRIAIELATHFQCEIISADSRQIYKEMSIGTAVPSTEELNTARHHFIKSHSIHNYYNASMFENEVLDLVTDYFRQHRIMLMVGGTGLYIDAVCKGIDDLPTIDPRVRKKWRDLYHKKGLEYLRAEVLAKDPDYYSKVDRQNHKRLLKALEVYELTGKSYSTFLKHSPKKREFTIIKTGINTNRKVLYNWINIRVDHMLEKGLLEEARKLYPFRHLTPLKTVGYKELFEYFEGKFTLNDAISRIKNHTRAYARRQLTWFRRDKNIMWFEPDDIESIKQYIKNRLKN